MTPESDDYSVKCRRSRGEDCEKINGERTPGSVDYSDYWFCTFDSDYSCDFNDASKDDNHLSETHPKHLKTKRNTNGHLSIQLRNARERNRVRAVNEAFAKLRKMVPYTANRDKRISKVKTLQKAVQYIAELEALLNSISY